VYEVTGLGPLRTRLQRAVGRVPIRLSELTTFFNAGLEPGCLAIDL
jgi:hypothetical protein